MNLDAASSAGRPSSRRMCVSSTATTTMRPSSAPAFELKCAAGRRRDASLIDCAQVNKLCRDDPPGPAVDLDAEILRPQRRYRPAVPVEHRGIDGDEINARAERGLPSAIPTAGRRRHYRDATRAISSKSLDMGCRQGHFKPAPRSD